MMNRQQHANPGHCITWLVAALLPLTLLLADITMADPYATQEDWERWFDEDFEAKAQQVNEGPLHFLAEPVAGKVTHAIHNRIQIHASSLTDQWVSLRQCHRDLDPVAESQIVYGYKAMRKLRITQVNGIGKAWIEDQSIQMTDISKGATLCIEADVPLLQTEQDGRHVLRNGPYYRRFLDGYYPFHVSLEILYPAHRLQVNEITPAIQPGFTASHAPGRLSLDAWFEGELRIAVRFAQHQAD